LKYEKREYKNGLRLLTSYRKETKAVTLLIMLKVGSRFEDNEYRGISHFIEHLTFKGTKRRPNTETLSRELDEIGAQFNAFTSKEYTGFYIKTIEKNLPLAFDMLSDMLFNSKFENKEIQREKGVIIEEMKMYEDEPANNAEELFETILFGNTHLGKRIIGTVKSVNETTRKKVLDYRQQFYQSGNMVVTVAGNYNKSKLDGLVKKYLVKNNQPKSEVTIVENKDTQKAPRVLLKNQKTGQVHLILGTRAYGKPEKEKVYPLSVLSIILGGSMSSRLFINVRERQGLCYYIYSSLDSYLDTGLFAIQAGLNKDRIDFAIKAILKELKKLRDNKITVKELDKAKEKLRGKIVLGLEDSQIIASWFAKQELLDDKTLTPEDYLKKISKVSVDDVQNIAQELFQTDRLNLAIVGPFGDKKRFEKILKI